MAIWTTMLMVAAAAAGDGRADPLTVLRPGDGGPPPNEMLYDYLAERAHRALAARREAYERLKTPEQCRAWQEKMKQFFLRQIGGLPPRTPLNARVVGRLQGDGYRVEKVIYESRPHHHVTAALYLPDAKPPYPAVLIPCGHSQNGKAAGYNQRLGILLARNGMAGFCYDPIGQGERSQILNEDGTFKHRATTEHTLVGVGAMLVGLNTAHYRISDGVRGIDYLASREDIDARRIGCTGCSGGGTLTSYIMALDDRVACAAPACYLTTFRRLIDTIGPQDAEQNIYGQAAFGMDQTDYVLMRAPKPTLICSTTRDFFDIEGSWDTFRQAKRFYARLGRPECVDLVEDDDRHGVTKLNRETLTHWMRRWLLGVDGHVEEPELPLWSDEDLQCAPRGQVMLLAGEKSVFDFNVQRLEELKRRRERRWADGDAETLREAVRRTARIRPLDELPRPRVRKTDTLLRKGYRIEKLVLEPDRGLQLPALFFVPAQPNGDAWLYLHEAGKQADAAPGGPIDELVRSGHVVLAVDVRGVGETDAGSGRPPFGEFKTALLAFLLGKPLAGQRAEDVLVCARFLRRYAASAVDGRQRPVRLAAVGRVGVPALHAAALQPQLFQSVQLRRTLVSWENVVRTPESQNQLGNAVPAALAVYDLPDLVRLAGEDKVDLIEPLDAAEQPARTSTPP